MPKPTAPADPLADLRQQDETPAGLTSSPEPDTTRTCVNCGNDDAAEGSKWCTECLELAALEARPQLWHDDAVAAMVNAWHNDETTASYLHHGGNCGCRYVARAGIVAVHGDPTTDDEQPED